MSFGVATYDGCPLRDKANLQLPLPGSRRLTLIRLYGALCHAIEDEDVIKHSIIDSTEKRSKDVRVKGEPINIDP